MKAMKKSLIMRGMILFHYLVMLLIFVACWMLFYRQHAMEGAFSTNSIAVCAMYAALLMLLSRVYGVYKVGLTHVSDLFYGQTLANLLSLFITYILVCVLARRLINPMAGMGAASVQALFCAAWTITANRLYFTLHKPKRTVVIYRNDNDLRKLEEIRFLRTAGR